MIAPYVRTYIWEAYLYEYQDQNLIECISNIDKKIIYCSNLLLICIVRGVDPTVQRYSQAERGYQEQRLLHCRTQVHMRMIISTMKYINVLLLSDSIYGRKSSSYKQKI